MAAALVLGCGSAGSGAGGSIGNSTVPGNGNQPPNSNDVPGSNPVPSNPNQPLSNSTAPGVGQCDNFCALVGKYSCVTIDPSSGLSCLAQCATALSNGTGGMTAACVSAQIDAILCADSAGLLYCDNQGNLSFNLKQTDTGGPCATEIAAAVKCETSTTSCGAADTCDGCTCLHPNDAQTACANVCAQTPNGGTCTLNGDACAGCPDNCTKCMCFSNNNATQCTTVCPAG